jgi:hypothetical protein
MARVKFDHDYDHLWPSGAMTAFKANWEGSVKAEVAEAAVKAKRARRTKLVADPEATSTATPRKRTRKRRARADGRKSVGVKGGRIDTAAPEPTLPRNLDPALAEPQALTPNLHEQEV